MICTPGGLRLDLLPAPKPDEVVTVRLEKREVGIEVEWFRSLGAVLAGVMLIVAKVFLLEGSLAALTNLLTPVSWGDVLLMFPILAGAGGVVSALTAWITLRFYIRV